MAKTWFWHGPCNWCFLNHNQCAQGCFMLNFRVLASILTDIFNFVTHSVSNSVTEWDVELCTWPEARGTANNQQESQIKSNFSIRPKSSPYFFVPRNFSMNSQWFIEAKCLYLPLSSIKPPASGADWLPAFNGTTPMIKYQGRSWLAPRVQRNHSQCSTEPWCSGYVEL